MRICRMALVIAGVLAVQPAAMAELTYEGSVPMGEYIMLEAGAAFQKKHGIKFDAIYTNGTEVALQALDDGKCHIAGVARDLTVSERKAGYTYEIIGYDALAVMVNEKNPVTGLSMEQLRGIFSGTIDRWQEVGGADLPIRKVADGTTGRTLRQEFIRRVMGGRRFKTVELTASPREHLLVVSRDPRAITFDSLALKPPGTRVLSIGGFLPSKKNVRSGNYPLRRPLYLVVKGRPRGDVKKFMKFMLSSQGQKIVGKGFVRVK